LRTKDDLLAIQKGLKDGTIEVIASDHARTVPWKKKWNLTWRPWGSSAWKPPFP